MTRAHSKSVHTWQGHLYIREKVSLHDISLHHRFLNMGQIGHHSEKVSPDHRVSPSSPCPLKTGFTVPRGVLSSQVLVSTYTNVCMITFRLWFTWNINYKYPLLPHSFRTSSFIASFPKLCFWEHRFWNVHVQLLCVITYSFHSLKKSWYEIWSCPLLIYKLTTLTENKQKLLYFRRLHQFVYCSLCSVQGVSQVAWLVISAEQLTSDVGFISACRFWCIFCGFTGHCVQNSMIICIRVPDNV